MKKINILVLSVLIFAGISGVALADSFTLASYTVTAQSVDPGLLINTSKILPSPSTFNLNVGQSATVDLFRIWTNEKDVGNDDKQPKNISVAFAFSAPPMGGTENGTTFGETFGFFGQIQDGQVTWNAPLDINFGGTGHFLIGLSNETFNYGWPGLNEGSECGAVVHAKLTYAAAPVPEPATMLMLGLGLVGLAGFGRKKFNS